MALGFITDETTPTTDDGNGSSVSSILELLKLLTVAGGFGAENGNH